MKRIIIFVILTLVEGRMLLSTRSNYADRIRERERQKTIDVILYNEYKTKLGFSDAEVYRELWFGYSYKNPRPDVPMCYPRHQKTVERSEQISLYFKYILLAPFGYALLNLLII